MRALSELDGRIHQVRQLAGLMASSAESLAYVITTETRKPIRESRNEVEKCIAACRYFAGSCKEYLAGRHLGIADQNVWIQHLPVGGVLVITPWNYPLWQVVRSTIPGLLAGNRMLIKPSPVVDCCSNALADLFNKAGFNPDTLQFIKPSTTGLRGLIQSPEIDSVFFTGNTETGRKIAAWSGQALKKSVLELGGSDPYIILKDADLNRAADCSLKSRFLNCGQRCNAAKRIIVEKCIEKDFLRIFENKLSAIRLGDPFDPATDMGPMISRAARSQCHRQVSESIAMGARLRSGGVVPHGNGSTYPPTLLTGVLPGMPAFDEETFGPLAAVTAAENMEEAICLANASKYGLGAAVFTKNRDHAREVALRVRSGSFAVNSMLQTDCRFPFGGVKNSGYGRELGQAGFLEACHIRCDYYPHYDAKANSLE